MRLLETRKETLRFSILILFPTLVLSFLIPTLFSSNNSAYAQLPVNTTAVDTFTVSGNISSWSFSGKSNNTAAPEIPYILAGSWQLQVVNGTTKAFGANMTMVKGDGTDPHTHRFSNFQALSESFTRTLIFNQSGGVSTTLEVPNEESSLSLPGTVDITIGNNNSGNTTTPTWSNVSATVMIRHWHALNMIIDGDVTQDHFTGGHNTPTIYGVVDSVKDSDGNELLQQGKTMPK